MNDKHMFAAAREVSFESDYTGGSKVKMGCVVAYCGTILARGSNTNKTHPIQDKYNVYRFPKQSSRYLPPKAHAELAAISKLKYLDIDWSKVHVYVYREYADGSLAMARPCAACIAAIKNEFHIKHIHYTSPDGYCHEVLK